MTGIRLTSLFALTVAGLLAANVSARAEMVSYKADLMGASEAPPTSSKATGSVTASYDTTSKMLTWSGTYSGLTGEATGAHFHGPAEVGKTAGVAVPLPSAKTPLEGSAVLTDAQAADLAQGKWYVNVHTAANPDGEIRGQVLKSK